MANTRSPEEKNKRLLKWAVIIVVGMFGFAYALVPMYNVLCKAVGLNGKGYTRVDVQAVTRVDASRMLKVQFLTTINSDLPWDFKALNKEVEVHPGKVTKVHFYVKNNANHAMTVQAIPSVSPGIASKHLHKTECFCFTQQTLKAGESMDMPMIFHFDRELPQDIKTITLSYTLFDTHIHPVENNLEIRS